MAACFFVEAIESSYIAQDRGEQQQTTQSTSDDNRQQAGGLLADQEWSAKHVESTQKKNKKLFVRLLVCLLAYSVAGVLALLACDCVCV